MKINMKKAWIIAPVLAAAAIYAGCNKGPDIKSYTNPTAVPQGISPNGGYPRSLLTINGSSFGDYKGVIKVYFNGVLADTVVSCEEGKIVVQVPGTAQSGKVSLQVWENKFDSIGNYTVYPPLMVSTTGLLGGLVGDTIIITGNGLGTDINKIKVKFPNIDGTVVSVNDSVITATVPSGTADGNLSVSVNDSLLAGPQFKLLTPVGSQPTYQLDFEGDLVDKISNAPAAYVLNDQTTQISYVNGISGKAVVLPGVLNNVKEKPNQAISIPVSIVKQKEFTVSCFVYWDPARGASQDPIFEFAEARGSRITMVTRMSGTWNSINNKPVGRYLLEKKVQTGGVAVNYEDYFAGPAAFPAGVWTHVAFTFSYANLIMKMYINGTLVNTKPFTRADVDPFLMNINRAYIAAPAYNAVGEPSFGGMMDKFQFYNTVLSQPEIYTLSFKK